MMERLNQFRAKLETKANRAATKTFNFVKEHPERIYGVIILAWLARLAIPALTVLAQELENACDKALCQLTDTGLSVTAAPETVIDHVGWVKTLMGGPANCSGDAQRVMEFASTGKLTLPYTTTIDQNPANMVKFCGREFSPQQVFEAIDKAVISDVPATNLAAHVAANSGVVPEAGQVSETQIVKGIGWLITLIVSGGIGAGTVSIIRKGVGGVRSTGDPSMANLSSSESAVAVEESVSLEPEGLLGNGTEHTVVQKLPVEGENIRDKIERVATLLGFNLSELAMPEFDRIGAALDATAKLMNTKGGPLLTGREQHLVNLTGGVHNTQALSESIRNSRDTRKLGMG